MASNFYVPTSALVIVAHPDDIEFSCAGTVARWTRAGAQVAYVLCTSGDAGIDEPGMTRAKATEIREAEQRAAAEIAGVHEVVFLRQPDGLLQPTLELRKMLVRKIRRYRPEVVVTGDPTVLWAGDDYINHPDHRAAATAALDAAFPAAGQPHVFEDLAEEGLKPHKVRKVYISGWSQSDLFVNIDETMDIKLEALKAHKSQMRDWDPSDMVRGWAAEHAKGKEMGYAESFRVITLVDDQAWEKKQAHLTRPGKATGED
ncbi:MAG: PIG-L deacetylase family protein [Anaerolineales bacterium]|jgi:LmbE family N-acetylglucosaminyl deacetylase